MPLADTPEIPAIVEPSPIDTTTIESFLETFGVNQETILKNQEAITKNQEILVNNAEEQKKIIEEQQEAIQNFKSVEENVDSLQETFSSESLDSLVDILQDLKKISITILANLGFINNAVLPLVFIIWFLFMCLKPYFNI